MNLDHETLLPKPSYPQNWRAYNAAQVNEKEQFLKLLHSLCCLMDPMPQQAFGRPRIPFSDILFACCFKIYSTVSGRRFMSDLKDAQSKGYISKTPHFNSIYNYLESDWMTAALNEMIMQTSIQFMNIETDFAVDSSGFTTSKNVRWFDHRYGVRTRQEWLKAHIVCGVKTNIITAAEITNQYVNDTKLFPALLEMTACNFNLEKVMADKAYGSFANYNLTDRLGAKPFIAFKSTSKGHGRNHTTGVECPIWRKMFHYFQYNRDEYLAHYHKRSNVESTFSMIKNKFGTFVRSKSDTAVKNEILAKLVCHNICVLIHEMYGLGLEVDFLKAMDLDAKPH